MNIGSSGIWIAVRGVGYNETTDRSLVVAINKSPSGFPLLCVKFCGVYFTLLSVIQRTEGRTAGRLLKDLGKKDAVT